MEGDCDNPVSGGSTHCSDVCQACVSADSSLVEAGRRLQALQELCDMLNPEEAHRLAQTQLRECQSRLADIQRQFSGDQDVLLPDSRSDVSSRCCFHLVWMLS